jgi:GTP-binding protein
MKFLDEAKIYLRSGNGGPGAVSFRREAHVPRGGPDGGDGGRGGDVIFKAVEDMNTLIDFRYQQHYQAGHGKNGEGKNRNGKKGQDIIVKVPVGTQVLDLDKKTVLHDFDTAGETVTLLKGGRGGKGNAHFKSSTNQAPRKAQPGEKGTERAVWLRLKLIADAGLVGMPNAGKSTLLAAVSAAKPKIADYPFTTKHPHLGMVELPGRRNTDNAGDFVLADIPGLIEGAHEGTGLGHRFLGHVERCGILIHVIDGLAQDIAANYDLIRNELAEYGHGLAEKEEIIALNKIDAMPDEFIDDATEQILAIDPEARVFPISAVTGKGIDQLLYAVYDHIGGDNTTNQSANQNTEYDPLG